MDISENTVIFIRDPKHKSHQITDVHKLEDVHASPSARTETQNVLKSALSTPY